jgi:hypothetical protein
MGAVAPTVGGSIFEGVTDTKNVTVRVPSGATGYDEAWQEAFEGAYSNINLVIQYDGSAPIVPEDGFTSLVSALSYLNTQSGGSTVADPVPLKLNVSIDADSLQALGTALGTAGKFVALDLSDSTSPADKVFPPDLDSTSGANKIVSLILPDDAETIPNGSTGNMSLSFKNFTVIKTVSGAGIKIIGDDAFHACTSLTSADFPKATNIGLMAFFNATSLTTANFPEATSIGNSAFSSCDSLSTVSFPKATSIELGAFSSCTSLDTVSFPLVTSIGNHAFWQCTSMTSASFPLVTSIGDNVFETCTSLTTLSFPLITSIGTVTFGWSGTAELTITMGNAAPSVGNYTFSQVSATKNVTVRVPNSASGYTDTWKTAFKGVGNTGSTGTVNENINLVIQYY